MSKNKYELMDRPAAGPIMPKLEKIYSQEEMAQHLLSYMNVPKNKWDLMRVGYTVSFVNTNNVFCIGGVIVKMAPDGIYYHEMCVNSYVEKKIDYKNISRLYKKIPTDAFVEITILSSQIYTLLGELNELKDQIRDLKNQLKE